jgi:hypothetical protein
MTDELFALATISLPAPSEGDYDAIFATVMESARGRWFLQEYARRNRNSDTEAVLATIQRIDGFVRRAQNQEGHGSLSAEIKELAGITAQALQGDKRPGAREQRLEVTLQFIERRLNAMIEAWAGSNASRILPRVIPRDPLAALKAMSPEEKIALFT